MNGRTPRCPGISINLDNSASGLIIKLLEMTHGQWLYCILVVHNETSDALANKRKEELQAQIEELKDLGGEDLLEEDKYLIEINLEDLECSSGERQTYWLLAVETYKRKRLLQQRAAASQEKQLETGV